MTAVDVNLDDLEDAAEPGTIPPFVKWVGGKRKMARDLCARILTHLAPGGWYIEPFLGGGAVALALPADTPMILADACRPLGTLWWWVQREPVAIATWAAGYGAAFAEGWNTEAGYAAARLEHNAEPWSATDWRPSARFLWLNHAGFNGLYRENAAGLLNVPWGRRKTVVVPSAEDLQAIAEHIARAEVYAGADFADTVGVAAAGDVIFADPPYDSEVNAFTSYTATKFGPAEQLRLRDALEAAIARGAAVITTNADTPRIRDLYGHGPWAIEASFEDRAVAADPAARVPAPCLIITGGVMSDLTPKPQVWPVCRDCARPYVLRRSLVLLSTWCEDWIWQRDCKHKKAPAELVDRRPKPRQGCQRAKPKKGSRS